MIFLEIERESTTSVAQSAMTVPKVAQQPLAGLSAPETGSGRAGQRRFRAEGVGALQQKAASNVLVKYGNNSYGIPAIHCAIMQGDESAVRLFLDHGASPNSVAFYEFGEEGDPKTALGYAAKYGQLNIARLLLERGAEMDYKIPNFHRRNYPAIVHAVRNNHPEMIKLLVEYGATINFRPIEKGKDIWGPLGDDPIYCAITSGSLESFKLLLELGCNLDHLPKSLDLLENAAIFGTIEMVKFLLDQKVPIDVMDKGYFHSALDVAVEKQDIEMTKLLIAHGAKIHRDGLFSSIWITAICRDNSQIIEILIKAFPSDLNDALFTATELGKINTVKTLLQAGGNVNARMKDTRKPLIFSAVQWPEILQLLIDKGADINPVFDGVYTTLHYAARNGVPESIHILIDAGSQINQKNTAGITPLHYAGSEKIVFVLLERGADLNIPDNFGVKPLFRLLARKDSSLSLIKEFIKRGASGLNDINKDGQSAVHFALYRTDGLLEYLVNEAEVSINAINAKDSYGRNPFFHAVDRGNFKAMELLFKNGADINTKDIQGKTPLSIAIKEHHELIEWLVLNGAK